MLKRTPLYEAHQKAGGKLIDVFGMPSPSFADFDGDGDLDLICGEFLDSFTYFENTGTRTQPVYAAGRQLMVAGEKLHMDLCMITPMTHDFNGDVQEDFLDPFSFVPGFYTNSVGITPQYRTRTNEYALFAEDRLQLTDQLSIVGGVRYEHNKVRRTTIAGAVVVNDKELNNTTWRVGAVYKPVPTVSLYAQYATGVDPLGTLTTYSGGQVAFSHATGKQIEVGAKAQFLGGRATATIAAQGNGDGI